MAQSVAALERQIDQLIARVRDLERDLSALRDEQGLVQRGYLEGALACIDTGQTPAAAIGAVSSGDQIIATGGATLLEIVTNGTGGWLLRPVQNSSGGSKAVVTYYNCADDSPVARSSSKNPMLLVRLSNGKFVRFPAGSGQQFDVRVKPDGTALQKTTDGGTTWTDWATIRDDC